MSKPIVPVTLWTEEGLLATVPAMFDTGSHRMIVREDALPKGAAFRRRQTPREFRTAGPMKVRVIGKIMLEVDIGEKRIECTAWIAPQLPRAFLIGAGAMQEWDISVVNRGRRTKVIVGLDMRDPEVTEVL